MIVNMIVLLGSCIMCAGYFLLCSYVDLEGFCVPQNSSIFSTLKAKMILRWLIFWGSQWSVTVFN